MHISRELEVCKSLVTTGNIQGAFDFIMSLDPNNFAIEEYIEIQSYLIYVYHYQGRNKLGNQIATKLLSELLNLPRTQHTNSLKGRILNLKALTEWQIGSVKQAFALNKQAQQLLEAYDICYDLCTVYNDLGIFLILQNRFPEALEYYEKALDCYTKIGNEEAYGISLQNIAKSYIYLDRVDEAIVAFNRVLEIFTKYGNQTHLSFAYHNLGHAMFKAGKIDKAVQNYLKALEIRKKLGNKNYIAATLSYLLVIEYEEHGLTDKLQEYHKEVQKLVDPDSDKILLVRAWFTQAIIYLASHRVFQKFQAKKLLEKIIANGDIDLEIRTYSLLQIVELLFTEALIISSDEVITELNKYLQLLENVQNAHHSKSLAVEINIYYANFALLNENLQNAENYFQKAITISKEHNLKSLLEKAQKGLNLMQQYVASVSATVKQNEKLLNSIKQQEVTNYMREVRKLKLIL